MIKKVINIVKFIVVSIIAALCMMHVVCINVYAPMETLICLCVFILACGYLIDHMTLPKR